MKISVQRICGMFQYWYFGIFFQKFLNVWMMYLYTAIIYSQFHHGKTDFEGMRSISVGPRCTQWSVPTQTSVCESATAGPITSHIHGLRDVPTLGDRDSGLIESWVMVYHLLPFLHLLTFYVGIQIQECPRIGRNSQNPLLNAKHNK